MDFNAFDLAALDMGRNDHAGSLVTKAPTATPDHTCEQVREIFAEFPELLAMPVVEDAIPIGLINRNIFLTQFAKPFHREVYGRKSCIAFMDKEPLIVDENTSIQDLSYMAVDAGGKTLTDGFIITAKHHYLGVGSAQDLIRTIADLQAEKNRLVTESIKYASIIQQSFLRSSREDLANTLSDYFMHWEPRDIVGGDYYYFTRFPDGYFAAVIDCTGHGVPGAFMTLIIATTLKHVLNTSNLRDPAQLLGEINRAVKNLLGQNEICSPDMMNTRSDDGMDTAFCWMDTEKQTMTFAGAKTPLYLIRKGSSEVETIKGDNKGVGYIDTPYDFQWTNCEIPLSKGDCVYISTDGIIDQIGGTKRIAFGKKRLKQLLLDHHKKPMQEQIKLVLHAFSHYQGKESRRDDVSLFGFRHQ